MYKYLTVSGKKKEIISPNYSRFDLGNYPENNLKNQKRECHSPLFCSLIQEKKKRYIMDNVGVFYFYFSELFIERLILDTIIFFFSPGLLNRVNVKEISFISSLKNHSVPLTRETGGSSRHRSPAGA